MRRFTGAIILLTLLAGNLAAAETRYVIKDLGILPGTRHSYAHAINNKGQVVCVSQTVVENLDPNSSLYKAFLWENGRVTELKIPGGERQELSMDINDSGQILMTTYDGSFIVQGDMVKKIEGLPENPNVLATAINNRADVVGRCAKGIGSEVPFFWHNGVTEALPVPLGCNYLEHVALNENGQVATIATGAKNRQFFLLWDNGKMRTVKGGEEFRFVRDLSEDGTIVGEGHDDKALVLRNGRCTHLKAPKGLVSDSASCINGKGIIAGTCQTEGFHSRPVVWDAQGVPTELPTLGGMQCAVADINDVGVIVGASEDKQWRDHAVMWTPVK